MSTRIELLEQLEKAVRDGVGCVHQLNKKDESGSFIGRLETKQKMDSAWREILHLLSMLETAPDKQT